MNYPESLFHYNALDSAITLAISDITNADVCQLNSDAYHITKRLIEPLMYMMYRGIRVDLNALEKMKIEIKQKIKDNTTLLHELAGRELNPLSPKDCKTYFYIEKGIDPFTKSVKSGGTRKSVITVDDKALQRLSVGTASRPPIKEARLIQNIRGFEKLLGTYLEIELDEDGRMRCSYNPRGTIFARLSSSKTIFGTGMNMQNLPYEFRQFLVADPGWLQFNLDKAKAEWVVVAYASGDPNMIKVIEENLDPHIHTAYLMTDIPKEIIEEEDGLLGGTSDVDLIAEVRSNMVQKSPAVEKAFSNAKLLPRNMPIRQCGKKSNHGLNYDEGARTFALTNEMLEADAKKMIDLYKNKAYPCIPLWHAQIQEKLRKNRTLTNCFGRNFRFLGMWGQDLFKKAYSYIPQSTVGDLMNTGLADSYYDQSTSATSIEILGQCHDSINGQISMENPELAALALVHNAKFFDVELSYNNRPFRIGNDLKVGKNLRDMTKLSLGLPINSIANKLMEVYNETPK